MNAKAMTLGSVVSVRRYPVKSMQGEEINEADITDRGILGDRAYALLDRTTGHIASAKHPRKWSKLLECRATFVEPPQLGMPWPSVWITLPDGAVICSSQPDIDQVLSHVLERDVTLLAQAPANPTREADRTPIDENLNSYWLSWIRTPTRLVQLFTDYGIQWAVLGILRLWYAFRENAICFGSSGCAIASKTQAGRYALAYLSSRWHLLIQEAINLRDNPEHRLYTCRLHRGYDAVRFLHYIIRLCNEQV